MQSQKRQQLKYAEYVVLHKVPLCMNTRSKPAVVRKVMPSVQRNLGHCILFLITAEKSVTNNSAHSVECSGDPGNIVVISKLDRIVF